MAKHRTLTYYTLIVCMNGVLLMKVENQTNKYLKSAIISRKAPPIIIYTSKNKIFREGALASTPK